MKILALLQRQPKNVSLAETTLIVLLIGSVDWLSGYEVSMSMFYGVPILAAIWLCDHKCGLLIAIICGITWWWADILAGHLYPQVWLSIWEPAVRFIYFGFVAIGGAALKDKHDATIARIALLEHSHRLEREIIEISEREQRRIGRDLHDGICQYLAAIGCAAGSLRADLLQKNLPREAAIAEELTELLEDGVVQTRDLARGLVPVPMDEAGLPCALDGLANSVARLQNIDCKFVAQGEAKIADPSAATHLYRIAQEAINNATRHGHASEIRIELSAGNNACNLRVVDNGVGILPTSSSSTGLGLSIMTYRARLVGGRLAISRLSTGGTEITCTFPPSAWFSSTDEAAA